MISGKIKAPVFEIENEKIPQPAHFRSGAQFFLCAPR